MARRGKKIDKFTWEDGRVFDIRLDKGSPRDTFNVLVDEGSDTYVADTDINEVKKKAKAWLKEHASLEWECLIRVHVESGYFAGASMPTMKFERVFRSSEKIDGTRDWARFGAKPRSDQDFNDFIKGSPTGKACEESGTHIPYTEENWRGLRNIKAMMRLLGENFERLMAPHELIPTLSKAAAADLKQLLFQPQEDEDHGGG